jgi:pantothenate kinase
VPGGLLARAAALLRPGRRSLLGITGAPGAGKSSLAAALAAAVPGSVVVPMDGFHLPTAVLERHGWVAERGTPRTFDAAGYVTLLRALRAGSPVTAPGFDRAVEEPVAGMIAVPAGAPLVITEGNYLLLEAEPWAAVRGLLDEVWYVEAREPVRIERLVARHVRYGRTEDAARERALRGSDAANARLVRATRARADLVVDLDAAEWPP